MSHHTDTVTMTILRDKLDALLDLPLDWDDNHPLDNRNSYSTFRGAVCQLRDDLADEALAATERAAIQPAGEAVRIDTSGITSAIDIDTDKMKLIFKSKAVREKFQSQLYAIIFNDAPAPPVCTPVQAAPDGAQDVWYAAAAWLRNNYQEYSNVASLCAAMEIAAPDDAAEPNGWHEANELARALHAQVPAAVQAAPDWRAIAEGHAMQAADLQVQLTAVQAAPVEAQRKYCYTCDMDVSKRCDDPICAIPAPEVKVSELPSIGGDAEFQWRLSNLEVASPDRDDGAHMRKQYDEYRASFISYIDALLLAARSPVAAPQPDVSARDGKRIVDEWMSEYDILIGGLAYEALCARIQSAAPESAEPSAGALMQLLKLNQQFKAQGWRDMFDCPTDIEVEFIEFGSTGIHTGVRLESGDVFLSGEGEFSMPIMWRRLATSSAAKGE